MCSACGEETGTAPEKGDRSMRMLMVLPIAVALGIFATTGCASTRGDAERALSSYLDASLNERHEEAYSYLSDDDRATMTLEEFTSEAMDNIVIKGDEFTSKTSYKVKGIEFDNGRARGEVEITEPNIRVILSDVLGALIASLLDEEEGLDELEAELKQKYSKGNIPMRTRTEFYDMVQEEGAWRIDLSP